MVLVSFIVTPSERKFFINDKTKTNHFNKLKMFQNKSRLLAADEFLFFVSEAIPLKISALTQAQHIPFHFEINQ